MYSVGKRNSLTGDTAAGNFLFYFVLFFNTAASMELAVQHMSIRQQALYRWEGGRRHPSQSPSGSLETARPGGRAEIFKGDWSQGP
jgi:hypothetical protein